MFDTAALPFYESWLLSVLLLDYARSGGSQ